MNLKLDENLPLRLVGLLKEIGHDVRSVRDERLSGHADSEIWEAAQSESRFLITQDLDFSDSRRFVPGAHHGILLVRLRTPNRRNLIDRIVELFQNESAGDWKHCFVVATERKIRVLSAESRQDG